MMKAELTSYIKSQLSTNPSWAVRALVKVYSLQTVDEQVTGQTSNLNNAGFNGIDSKILSSFAEQVNKGRNLSPKQMSILFKKMPRYHRQVLSFIPADKLEEIKNNLAAKV
jgi:hypothetical protein